MFYAHFVWDNSKFGPTLVFKLKLFSGKLLSVYSFFSAFSFLMGQCNTDDNFVLHVFWREGAVLEWFFSGFTIST